jgi:hypothetical protein
VRKLSMNSKRELGSAAIVVDLITINPAKFYQ